MINSNEIVLKKFRLQKPFVLQDLTNPDVGTWRSPYLTASFTKANKDNPTVAGLHLLVSDVEKTGVSELFQVAWGNNHRTRSLGLR